MDPIEFEKYATRLRNEKGLFPAWRRRRAARALGEGAASGDLACTDVLARTLADAVLDPDCAEIAEEHLLRLGDPTCIDRVCAHWARTGDPRLSAILQERAWIAEAPPELRVLTALEIGREDLLDPVTPELLHAILSVATSPRGDRFTQRARRMLAGLTRAATVDELCRLWATSRHPLLTEALLLGNFVARRPPRLRVLTALKGGKQDLLRGDGPEGVDLLISAAADNDPDIRRGARAVLSRLRAGLAVDRLCRRWAESREPLLAEAIVAGGYVAQEPLDLRVRTALKCGRLDAVTGLGPEVVDPLVEAARDREAEVAARARQALGMLLHAGAVELICRRWEQRGEEIYEQAVVEGSYVATKPLELRIRTALKVGRQDLIAPVSPDLVRPLFQASRDRDPRIAAAAAALLRGSRGRRIADEICDLWVESRSDLLLEMILEQGLIVKLPARERVQVALRADRSSALLPVTPEIVPFLSDATRDEDPAVAERAAALLATVDSGETLDALWNRWARTGDPELRDRLLSADSERERMSLRARILRALASEDWADLRRAGPEIVEPLMEIAAEHGPGPVVDARVALRHLGNPTTIDLLCEIWSKLRDPMLRAAMEEAGYLARAPERLRVLSALAARRRDPILDGDRGVVEVLLELAQDSDPDIAREAEQALAEIRDAGAVDHLCGLWVEARDPVLARAVTAGRHVARQPLRARVLSALKAGRLDELCRIGVDGVRLLLLARSDPEPGIAARAAVALASLESPEARDFLCEEVMRSPDDVLRSLVMEAGFEPRRSEWRAAFRFLCGPWPTEAASPALLEELRAGYRSVGVQIRRRLRAEALGDHPPEILSTLILGSEAEPDLRGLTDAEWRDGVEGLRRGGRWRHLLRLLVAAPPAWSAGLLATLREEARRGAFDPADLPEGARALWSALENLSLPAAPVLFVGLGERVAELQGHEDWVNALAPSGDGRLLASASNDGSARLWDLRAGGEVVPPLRHPGAVVAVAVDRAATLLATSAEDAVLRVWRTRDGSVLRDIPDAGGGAQALAMSPDGATLLTGSADWKIRRYRVADGEMTSELGGHEGRIAWVGFGAEPGVVVSGGGGGRICVWDTGRGEATLRIETRGDGICAMALARDGSLLATGDQDGSARLWSLPEGRPLHSLPGHGGAVRALAISPDGGLVASGDERGDIRLWRVFDGRLLAILPEPGVLDEASAATRVAPGKQAGEGEAPKEGSGRWSVADLAISAEGSMLLCADDYRTIRVRRLTWPRPLGLCTPSDLERVQRRLDGRAADDPNRASWDLLAGLIRARLGS